MRKTSSNANLSERKFTRVDGDLNDLESLKRAAQGMNYIYHLAGITSATDGEIFYEHNTRGTARMAEAALSSGDSLHRFVHVSSLAAGGPVTTGEPRNETQADSPTSQYGKSKLAGEKELLKFKDRYPIVIVRPPMVYGPRDKNVFMMIHP